MILLEQTSLFPVRKCLMFSILYHIGHFVCFLRFSLFRFFSSFCPLIPLS